MRRKHIFLYVATLFTVLPLLLAGCGTIIPRLHFVPPGEAETKFPGIAELATDTNVPVRVFLIHGVSHHDFGWATNTYLNPVLTQLGWHFQEGDNGTEWKDIIVSGANTNGFAARLTRYTIADRNFHRMVAYELTWSPLVDPFKSARLASDEPQPRPYANQKLREALDDSLVDAVLYASKFDNDIMARSTSQALKMFYDGDLDSEETRQQLVRSPVVLITESLGSKMLFDAIRKDQAANSASVNHNQAFEQMIKNNLYIFMMANQLALLDMPEPRANGPVPPPTATFFAAASQSPSLKAVVSTHAIIAPETPLLFVAFSDLYDDLSWKVRRADLGFEPGANVTIDNFNPVNSWNYFGFIEDPRRAHTRYGANAKVVETVVRGYKWK